MFEDAPTALKYLCGHYPMATVTNCDRISYRGYNAKLEVVWDGCDTAQDIGSYKPNSRNFDYLLAHAHSDLRVLTNEILHGVQSLTHDHVPATKAGLPKVWINRRPPGPMKSNSKACRIGSQRTKRKVKFAPG